MDSFPHENLLSHNNILVKSLIFGVLSNVHKPVEAIQLSALVECELWISSDPPANVAFLNRRPSPQQPLSQRIIIWAHVIIHPLCKCLLPTTVVSVYTHTCIHTLTLTQLTLSDPDIIVVGPEARSVLDY